MGRPLRYHPPGTRHLVTSRCHQARLFLRPDPEMNRAVIEWLARAQHHWPGVLVLAVCVMSNHLHVLVQDTQGELADWAGYFLGNLARATNRIRGRCGHVFSRRYSAEPVLDEAALLDRLVYIVTNPIQARLCSQVDDWPGVVLWSGSGEIERHRVDRDERRASWDPGAQGIPTELVIHPLADVDGVAVSTAIQERERELGAEREAGGRGVLGRARILGQRWYAQPRESKSSPRPLCHAADSRLRAAFKESLRSFAASFREASTRLREGMLDATFPPWSYPPGRQLVRA